MSGGIFPLSEWWHGIGRPALLQLALHIRVVAWHWAACPSTASLEGRQSVIIDSIGGVQFRVSDLQIGYAEHKARLARTAAPPPHPPGGFVPPVSVVAVITEGYVSAAYLDSA
jgi:hypothetical protein